MLANMIPRNQIQSNHGFGGQAKNNDTLAPQILIACWLVEGLSAIFLVLRIFCKLIRSRRLWYDDYILIAAWLFQTGNVVLVTVNVTLGEGQHVYNVDPAHLPTLGLNGNISGTLSILAACLSKTSFGVTLLRLTQTRPFVRISVWFLIISMNVALGLSAVFIWAQCNPPAKNWNPDIEGTCWPPTFTSKYGIFSGSYSAFADFALSIIPWPMIWKLHMLTKEKIGVGIAVSMGVLSGIAAIAKTVQLRFLSSGDFTYYESEVVIWGTVETGVAIIAASIPFLRVLIVEAKSSLTRNQRELTPEKYYPARDHPAGSRKFVPTSDNVEIE
ncbi:hypothetical protein B0H63DRAFT_557673 [Podospora didyma]|uniref:Rhodopsin domain-containing protein n=1 Tax=Podospora didyma TaxID=330526 RepID=A0AAE0NZW6_9PEZI|nr:hypothetical protein B0H63DRAFT_557673 [Podospora didyma]